MTEATAAAHSVVTRESAQRVIDAKTKPLGALGLIETCAIRLAMLQQTHRPIVSGARVCVFGADHGVTDEGVSAYPRAVTAEMMKNFGAGGAAINVLARANGIEVEVIDVGVDADITHVSSIVHDKVARGTRNFAKQSAMTEEQLSAAMLAGADAARRAHRAGMHAIGLGEMGIGNTTSASALLSMLTGESSLLTVGLGTGITQATLELKRLVVERAVAMHASPDAFIGARECMRRVGGLELGAIAGAALEAARLRMAVVADGFISTVAIVCAAMMAREVSLDVRSALSDCVFLSHRSAERAHQMAIDAFNSATGESHAPLLDLGLRLGEGTGAALAIPLLRSAAAIMREMATFESAGVSKSDGVPN